MLFLVEFKVPVAVTMNQCTRGDHFGVNAGMARYETPKIPAVPVAPVHAGCCAKTPRAVYFWLARIIHYAIVA